MATLWRNRLLDRAFLVGVIVKGIDGIGELLLGIPLLFLGAPGVQHLATLTAGEAAEVSDGLARLVVTWAGALAGGALFAAIYLVLHGLVKVVLAVAVLRGAIWAYPWMLAALVAFLVLQVVQLVFTPSWGLVGLSAFDLLVVWLTWVEWRRHRAPTHSQSTLGAPLPR